jgi:hypothetical protein
VEGVGVIMPNLILDKEEAELLDKVDWDKTMEKHQDKFSDFIIGEKGWSIMDLESIFVLEQLTDDEIIWS